MTATIDDDDLASRTDLAAGEQVIDVSENLITVHGLRQLPGELAELGSLDLFNNTEDLIADSNLGALDVAMCAAGEFASESTGAVRFAVVPELASRLGESSDIFVAHALVAPGFVFPEPGACTRGWVPVTVDRGAGVARYVLSISGSQGMERHLYQWSIDGPVDSGDERAASESFGLGEVVTFHHGPLAGTTVMFSGWAELIDQTAPAGTRLVGVKLTVCPATQDWPEFGVAVDDWNLIGVLDPGDQLGANPLAPLTGNCFADWAEFAVPLGMAPTGFFVSDGVNPVTGFALWTLDGGAIRSPESPSG